MQLNIICILSDGVLRIRCSERRGGYVLVMQIKNENIEWMHELGINPFVGHLFFNPSPLVNNNKPLGFIMTCYIFNFHDICYV